MTLREMLHNARPDLVERREKNALKRAIAIKLRALRDAKGLSQTEVAETAELTRSMVARLERLSGPVPNLQSIERYVEACGGRLTLLITDKQVGGGDKSGVTFVRRTE